MATKNGFLADDEHFFTLTSPYASRDENVREIRLSCKLRANVWLLTLMFSHLLSLTLETLKNGEITHCFKAVLRPKEPHIV